MFPRPLPAVLLVCLLAAAGCPAPSSNPPAPPQGQDAAPPAVVAPADTPAVVPVSDVPADVVNPVTKAGFLSDEEIADGWISLFDGHSLFGWEPDVKEVNWSVKEGVITADTGPIGLLMTTVKYANFELVVEYQAADGGNSGVFLRTAETHSAAATDFYEVNIADTHPEGFLTASLVARNKADKEIKGSGGWNTMRMISDGDRIAVYHNSEKVLDYIDSTSGSRATGRIGLQKNVGKIEFRKVVLKPLGLKPQIAGEGLTGWKQVPGSKAKFENQNGEIHVVNGPGFLETEEVFQDFVLQAQAKTGAANLNSGIFFRALPGTEANPSHGYELQVHNGVKNKDRAQPLDSGSGAIFRRVPARRVVGDDLAWVTLTLVADGARFATFVNGYQVVAWEDTRADHDNPREGRKLGGGHLSLQGHDATTDVWFRNLRIVETPASGGSVIPPSFAPQNPAIPEVPL